MPEATHLERGARYRKHLEILFRVTLALTLVFFFNHTATAEIYTLSLHDALPISTQRAFRERLSPRLSAARAGSRAPPDRKSTRLNSSHSQISYAVFCLKKKKVRPPDLVT